MAHIIYGLLLTLVLIMYGWSKYIQRELTVNNVTLKVGDSFSWVLFMMISLGVLTIIMANILHLQVWKIFIMLMGVMGVNIVILWLTATWILAMTSHRVQQGYRIKYKHYENGSYIATLILSIGLMLSILLFRRDEVTVLLFLFVPIICLLERVVNIKRRIKHINTYELYTEEEVQRANKNLEQAIKSGKALQPKKNVLRKLMIFEKRKYKALREEDKTKRASQHLEEVKRKNDKQAKDDDEQDESNKDESNLEEESNKNNNKESKNRKTGDKK